MLLKDLFVFLPKSKRSASYGKSEGKFPFFTSSNTVDKYVDEPDYQGSYLIIGDGGTGNCKYYDGGVSASDHNYVMLPKKGTNPHCVWYFLAKNNFQVLNEGFKGIGIKNVSKTYIENIDYRYNPELSEDYICQTLRKIEELINKEQYVLALLDELTKSRFIEMFGEVNKLTCKNGIRLGKICKTIGGGTPSTKYPEFYKGDIPWISTVALGPNFIDGKSAKGFITKEAIEKSATHLIPKGSIMVGTRVGVGKCSINLIDMCTNQDICSIVELNENYNPLFIKHCLDCYQFYFDSIKKGATILGISSDDLKKVLIPVININVQNQFVSFVKLINKLKFSRLVGNFMFFSSKNMVLEGLA